MLEAVGYRVLEAAGYEVLEAVGYRSVGGCCRLLDADLEAVAC